jgi:hypothetical protein
MVAGAQPCLSSSGMNDGTRSTASARQRIELRRSGLMVLPALAMPMSTS